jgi:predicted GTPase
VPVGLLRLYNQVFYINLLHSEDIDKYLERVGFYQVGKNYNTIAIIGAQSTGKSTLLNKLFDTNFDVMATSVGRAQTTKGVWVAAHKEKQVLILDCEGTDSKERGEDRHKFEHSSSLFCLAMADVLVINMWTNVIFYIILFF